MRRALAILALTVAGLGPGQAGDAPAFEIEFLPGAGAQALQTFVATDYAEATGLREYGTFVVTVAPGVARLRLPREFRGSLHDLVEAAACLSGSAASTVSPQGVTFTPATDAGDRPACQRWRPSKPVPPEER